MTDDVESVVRGLSKAARRSITEMRPEWCCSFNAQGHQFLTGRGLVEHIAGNCGRLTPLGLAARQHLLSIPQPKDSEHDR